MSEYHAAIGLASLAGWAERRTALVTLHAAHLDRIASLGLPVTPQARPRCGAYSIFPLLMPDVASRERVEMSLTSVNAQYRRWYYPPLQLHALFRNCRSGSDLAVTGDVAARLLCIPYHLRLTPAETDTIMTTLRVALA